MWQKVYESEDHEYTMNVMESRFIQEHNTHYLHGYGYNMTYGGNGMVLHSHSDIEKMKLAQRKRYEDPNQRLLTSEAVKKSYTPELLAKRKETARASYTPKLREIRRQQLLTKNPAKNADVRIRISNSQKKRFESPEERLKLSIARKKSCENPDVLEKMRAATKQQFQNPTARKHLSELQKARFENPKVRQQSIAAKNRPHVICPHCQKTGNVSIMKRWHYDNCKMRTDE